MLIAEDLLTRQDLLGLDVKDFVELGIEGTVATKLQHLLAERARRQRPTRGHQARCPPAPRRSPSALPTLDASRDVPPSRRQGTGVYD